VASSNDHQAPDPQVEPRSTAPRRYSAAYKAKVLAEYETSHKQGKGAEAALAAPSGRPKADPRDTEIARLKSQVARLETELGKARTVIEVQGKLPRCSTNSPRTAPRGTARPRDHPQAHGTGSGGRHPLLPLSGATRCRTF